MKTFPITTTINSSLPFLNASLVHMNMGYFLICMPILCLFKFSLSFSMPGILDQHPMQYLYELDTVS